MAQQITDSYIIDILQLLKNVAFHEIFMEKLREQLADDQKFEPFNAFKTIDSFKHNMIISVELRSFLQLQGYQVTNAEAEEAIKALNKSEDSLNYDRFIEMVMPYNIKKRNFSLSRYSNVEVGIGTYYLVNQIKNNSRQNIAKLFIKQIEFYRNFLSQRQYFCQKWGADIYTISQCLFKTKNNHLDTSIRNPLFDYEVHTKITPESQYSDTSDSIGFQRFYEFSRKYKCYFNKEEFKSIWRRIKKVEERIILKPEQVFLQKDDFLNFLLVKNFNTKLKYANEYAIPLKNLKINPPSYKLPVSPQIVHNSYQYRQKQEKEYINRKINSIKKELDDPCSYRLKQTHSYPELHYNTVSVKLRQKQMEWKDIARTMNSAMIDQRYHHILQQQRFRPFK